MDKKTVIFISAYLLTSIGFAQENTVLPKPTTEITSTTQMASALEFKTKSNDNQEPLELKADTADINQSAHKGTYIGAIEFDQGNTHIRADKALTRTDDNNKLIEAVIYGNKNNQAHYWSVVSQDKPALHAYADVIKYLPVAKVIQLIGNARIEQGENVFTAANITYNIEKQHIVSSGISSQQRTVIIFHPQRKKE